MLPNTCMTTPKQQILVNSAAHKCVCTKKKQYYTAKSSSTGILVGFYVSELVQSSLVMYLETLLRRNLTAA